MRNAFAVLAAVFLLAAAFFLPAALAQWEDRRLLDEPHITRQDQEREGFAESLQLSVAEKLLLLRSASVTSVALDAAYEAEEAAQKWEQRLERVQRELWSLQTLGAMPYLWSSGETAACTGYSQRLYIDQESQVSFLAYTMSLNCAPYSIHVMADAKSERILGFRLSWTKGAAPSWGFRGCTRFGTAWRDYWGMDSVSAAWNSEYIRSILEMPEEEFLRSGSYNSNADVAFSYGGQNLRVPLVNWVYSNSDGVLEWNLM